MPPGAGINVVRGGRGRRLRAADRAARRADVDVAQGIRVLPKLGRDLHHHVVLVERIIDRRHLALTERVIKRVVDLRRADAQPRRRVAVDLQLDVEPLRLLIRIDVLKLGSVLERRRNFGDPGVYVCKRVGLDCVLVLGIALTPAGANVLHRLQEKLRPSDARQLRAQPRNDLIARLSVPIAKRLELDENKPRVGRAATAATAAARKSDDVFDRGILAQDGDELRELLFHELERDALVGANSAYQGAGVLLRQEAFRDDREEIDVEGDGQQQDEKDRAGIGE